MSFLRFVFAIALAAAAVVVPAQSDGAIPLRISVENTESHVQTQAVAEFARRIQAALGDSVRVEFHHSASMLRDSQVVPAIARGEIEMAVPGTWHLGNYVA